MHSQIPKRMMAGTGPICDADLHLNDSPQALAPHCSMPWRKSLEMMGKAPQRYLDISGYSVGMRQDPPIPGGHPKQSVSTAREMRDALDMLGIDAGILMPDHLLLLANLANTEYVIELMRSYNRWLIAEWLQEDNGLYGAIIVCSQDIDSSVQEIERYATTKNVKAVFLPTSGVSPLWGARRYDKILAACEAADFPVILHSVSVVSNSFPNQLEQFENQYARNVLMHSFAMQANLVSLMHTGVPVRFPKLKIAFTEAGISWVPHILWRLDRFHAEVRRTVPFLEERPSDYAKRCMWYSTQPIEEPDRPEQLVEVMHTIGTDRIMFASDWPHHDFDHPVAIRKLPLTPEERHHILWQNCANLFKLPMPARYAKTKEAVS